MPPPPPPEPPAKTADQREAEVAEEALAEIMERGSPPPKAAEIEPALPDWATSKVDPIAKKAKGLEK